MAQAQVFQPVDQAIGVVQGVFTPARSTYWKMKRSWRLRVQVSSAWRRRARFQARLTGIVALRAASVVALTETARARRRTPPCSPHLSASGASRTGMVPPG